MTPQEIKTRLAEITAAQDAFAARDLDAELSTVMTEGGDLDALEEAQLQAERDARRLRVERTALEAALPAAEVQHARETLDKLAAEHSSLKGMAEDSAKEVARAINKAAETVAGFREINARAAKIGRMAEIEAGKIRDSGGKIVRGEYRLGPFQPTAFGNLSIIAREEIDLTTPRGAGFYAGESVVF